MTPLLRTDWGLTRDGGAVDARAECGACAASASVVIERASIADFPDDGALDAGVRAVVLRRLVAALVERECEHAALDPVALAACAMRPERARRAEAFALATGLSDEAASAALASHLRRTDWDAASLRLRIGQAGDEVRGALEPAEAWETYSSRGLIPIEWTGDASHAYESGGLAARGHPPTLRAAVTLAADAPGVAEAEALGREVAHRLEPFGVAPVTRVLWRVVDPAVWRPEREPGFHPDVRAMLGDAAATPLPWWDLVSRDARHAARWTARRAPRDHADRTRRPGALASAMLARLPNPFEPVVSVWLLGYAVDVVAAGTLVMAAPAL